MTIEIKGSGGGTIRNTTGSGRVSTKSPAGKTAASSSAAASGGGDRISLTASATEMHRLGSMIASLPVVDDQLVSEIQHVIATGNFHVDTEKAADKILNIERAFAE